MIDGVPLVIIQDGQPIERTLAAERMPLDEVYEAARQHGIDSLAKVRLGVLEPSGRISFIQFDERRRPRNRPPTEVTAATEVATAEVATAEVATAEVAAAEVTAAVAASVAALVDDRGVAAVAPSAEAAGQQ